MNENEFKERCERLKEVNKVIGDLDPAIRERAYASLEEYVTGQPTRRRKTPKGDDDSGTPGGKDTSNLDRDDFILAHHDKDDQPSDSAILIAAWHYKEYGTAPFTIQEIKDIAADAGLTIPGRLDMTFRGAKQEGKKCFTSAGRGKIKPTVHGEKRLKDDYTIKKGNKTKPANGDD